MSFTTADLADAHEDLRTCDLQFRSYGKAARFSGEISTVRCHDHISVKRILSQPGAGKVLVVDGEGSMLCALVGDTLAGMAVANGWAGIVVHGAIRDSAAIAMLDLGIKALGTIPRKSARAGECELDVPVKFGGVVFTPGDYLYADEDGIVVGAKVPTGAMC
jgi:regulator of ribonuclease activity A